MSTLLNATKMGAMNAHEAEPNKPLHAKAEKAKHAWRKDTRGDSAWSTVLSYSGCWLVIAGTILTIFNMDGRSFLWDADGLYQHFNSFNYICDYLAALLVGNPLPAFNYTLGQGLDVLGALGQYDFADPISWLTACLFPLSRLSRYTVMVFAKLYLAGLSFILLARIIGHRHPLMITSGAIAYVFCGSILSLFACHPNFVSWSYYLPLILSGVELYRRRGKAWLLIAAVCVNLVTSFYTFYMCMVMAVIYALVRSIAEVIRERNAATAKREAVTNLKLAGFCLVGIALASAVAFPALYAYSQCTRIFLATGYDDSLFWFEPDYYQNLAHSLFAPYARTNPTPRLGWSAVMFIPLVVLFMHRGNGVLKALWVISVVILCLPLASGMMNGFNYPTTRWCFALSLLGSFTLLTVWPQLAKPHRRDLVAVAILAAAYAAYVLTYAIPEENGIMISAIVALGILVIAYLAFGIAKVVNAPAEKPPLRRAANGFNLAVFALTSVCALYGVCCTFPASTGNFTSVFFANDELEEAMSGNSAVAAKNMEDSFYRIEQREHAVNRDGFNGTHGTSAWWSVLPSSMTDYYADLGLDSMVQNCNLKGLDSHVALAALAGAKYYTCNADDSDLIPFGYEPVESSNPASSENTINKHLVFKSNLALPVGYTYDGYVSREAYQKLNPPQKEQALLQGAVIESAPAGFEELQASFAEVELPFTVTKSTDATYDEHGIVSSSNGSRIMLSADVPANSELFLFLDRPVLAPSQANISITVKRSCAEGKSTTNGALNNSRYKWPVKRDAMTFNLGFSESGGISKITIKFSKECEINFESLRLIAIPDNAIRDNLLARSACTLQDVEVGNDEITGSIDAPARKILQLAIPYSRGWSAEVDGKPTDLFTSGGMYMAMTVEAGQHRIELHYRTPFLLEGTVITVVTLVALVVVSLLRRRRARGKTHLPTRVSKRAQ